MKATMLAAFLVSGLLVTALPVSAHHSFAAEFDINKPVSLKGTLTKMAWVNPHGWIYMDVKTPDGKVENWAIEAGGPTALLRRGLRATDFPVGPRDRRRRLSVEGRKPARQRPEGDLRRRPQLLPRS